MNALIEKQALKELVDTFSNLADEKKVAEQMPLFTENAVVNTYIGGKLVFAMTGRAEIEHVFSTFLAPFHTVYHLNGQFTVTDLQADSAAAITYCQVHLVEEKDGKNLMQSHSVRYQDRYVKQDGQWLIAHRVANFMISDTRELGASA